MSKQDTTPVELAQLTTARGVSRRQVLKRGGALAGAAAILTGSQLAAGASEHGTLDIDVACDGRTFTLNPLRPDGAHRGDTFIVQGKIYPGGTIEQGLSGPMQGGSIGTWVCRGWLFFGLGEMAEGAVPHAATTQHFLFDDFNGLVTDGFEGGIATVRPIIGGHGMYAHAQGVSNQAEVEENNTLITLGEGIQVPAPNIRFDFRFGG